MEIRANYIAVGLFTILMVLGGLGFTLWIASRDKGVEVSFYDISFNESIKGLSRNSDVLFIGIRVGRVVNIKISDVTPGEARVRVAIAADTPVREDSMAQLQIQGLTGGVVISITGGTAGSPLKRVPVGAVGEIAYEPSPLSSVVAQMPDVISAASQALHQVEKVFSQENAEAITSILASLNVLAAVLADRSDTIDDIVADTEKLIQNFDILTVSANKALTTDVRSTAEAMNNIAQRLDKTLGVMEPGLREFSTQGLADMRLLMVEMRNLVHVLTRVSQKMESDPRRFFFGSPVPEYTNH
jgi:phospholipid/cholesterol/gamma-HCH transport system substrate-binding protein